VTDSPYQVRILCALQRKPVYAGTRAEAHRPGASRQGPARPRASTPGPTRGEEVRQDAADQASHLAVGPRLGLLLVVQSWVPAKQVPPGKERRNAQGRIIASFAPIAH